MADYKFQFSPSLLNLFNDCPRCGWFHIRKGIKRPRGIFPGLPAGMDRLLKTLFDKFRRENEMPAELESVLPSGTRLVSDKELIHKWQDWRTGLSYTSKQGVKIIGALDDCLESEDGLFSPLDYKTRGSVPGPVEDSDKYYGLQLSTYSFLLRESGRKITGKGYLIYYYPVEVKPDNSVIFKVKPVELNSNPNRACDAIKQAVDVLKKDVPPDAKDGCEWCSLREGL